MKIVKIILALLVVGILFFNLFEASPLRNVILYSIFGFLVIIILYPFIRKLYLQQMMNNLSIQFKVDRYLGDEDFIKGIVQEIDQLPYTETGPNLRQYSKVNYLKFEELNAILIRFEKLKQK